MDAFRTPSVARHVDTAYSGSMASTLPASPPEAVAPSTVLPRRWTVEEFDRIPDDVFPEGERIELIDGQIYTKMDQGLPHITAVQLVFRALLAAYGPGFNLAMGLPVAIGESKPEPDVRVLRGAIEDFDGRYPDPMAEIALVVEVSETSLAYDLGPKATMYARVGVPEYWILDLAGRALEVRRRPRPERGEYAETTLLREGETVTIDGAEIEVAALLPKAA